MATAWRCCRVGGSVGGGGVSKKHGGGAQRNGGSAVAAARRLQRWRQRDSTVSCYLLEGSVTSVVGGQLVVLNLVIVFDETNFIL